MNQISPREGALQDQIAPLEGVVVDSPEAALSPAARASVEKGKSAQTTRAYNQSWAQFERWCYAQNREPLPASSATITEYTHYLAYEIVPGGDKQPWMANRRGLSPASIERALAAIYAKHREADADLPSREESKKVLRGYRAELGASRDPRATQRQAPIATRNSIEKVMEFPAEPRMIALRNRALVLLGFAVAARLSELVLINIGDVHRDERGLEVTVYRQKMHKHTDVAIPETYAPGIVQIITDWIATLAAAGITSGPLFPRMDRHGHIGAEANSRGGSPDGRMTPDQARRILRRISVQVTKEGRWTGHSLRRGLATESRNHGNDQITIGPHGGWAKHSASLTRYMEDADKWINNALKGMNL